MGTTWEASGDRTLLDPFSGIPLQRYGLFFNQTLHLKHHRSKKNLL